MKKGIRCHILIHKEGTEDKACKIFKINCYKAKVSEIQPKNILFVFEVLFSGRERPLFTLSKGSRKIRNG